MSAPNTIIQDNAEDNVEEEITDDEQLIDLNGQLKNINERINELDNKKYVLEIID